MAGKADITWRSRGILSFGSSILPGAQKRKRQNGVPRPGYFAVRNGQRRHTREGGYRVIAALAKPLMAPRTASFAFADDDTCTWVLTLGIPVHHALASPGAFADQTNNEQPNRLPQGVEEHTDEIASVRNAGRRISAVRLQPLP
jgi:hypothetical protein